MSITKLLLRLLTGRRSPVIQGTIQVDGIRGPVTIRRDRYGIPTIEAEDEFDAWYGLGFCHGQDRGFQLEFILRLVRGTLSALIGPQGLPVDRLSRRIGFRRAAQRQLEAVDEDIRRQIEAYVRGARAGSTAGCPRKPHEFLLLRAEPTPYEATDALGYLQVVTSGTSSWDMELARLKILQEDGVAALQALDPTYADWHTDVSDPSASARAAIDRLAQDLGTFQEMIGPAGGSNNWAIAGARTATGRPILANDPHLSPFLPPFWYLAHLRTPAWEAAGASFVGGPAFPAGHNAFLAWGITDANVDCADVFIEQLGPDGRSVRQGDGFVPCTVYEERIEVRGQEAVVEQVLETPRGPIIGPAIEGAPIAISLCATWLGPWRAHGLINIHRATSTDELRTNWPDWPYISANIVYATVDGHIGWQVMSSAPQRRRGSGSLPMPGWLTEAGWEAEPVPAAQMPHLLDPASGFIATANNEPLAEGSEVPMPFLGLDWPDGYRIARINEALSQRQDWDLRATQALQLDDYSIPWRELREPVIGLPCDEQGLASNALALLKAWDGIVAADSAAVTLFEQFLVEMSRRAGSAKAPRSSAWALGKTGLPTEDTSKFALRRAGHLVRLMRGQPQGWFARGWQGEMLDALGTVWKRLAARYGGDPSRWGWGRVRPLRLAHPIASHTALAPIFDRTFAWGGDTNTIDMNAVNLLDSLGSSVAVASLRMVLDVGNWDESRFSLPGGQSGNPLSAHYDDLLEFWKRGEGVPIAWSEGAVAAATEAELLLQPSGRDNHVAS